MRSFLYLLPRKNRIVRQENRLEWHWTSRKHWAFLPGVPLPCGWSFSTFMATTTIQWCGGARGTSSTGAAAPVQAQCSWANRSYQQSLPLGWTETTGRTPVWATTGHPVWTHAVSSPDPFLPISLNTSQRPTGLCQPKNFYRTLTEFMQHVLWYLWFFCFCINNFFNLFSLQSLSQNTMATEIQTMTAINSSYTSSVRSTPSYPWEMVIVFDFSHLTYASAWGFTAFLFHFYLFCLFSWEGRLRI